MAERNPYWTYEEAVLLFALYRREPKAARTHPLVAELSRLLVETAALRGVVPSRTYRNPVGVAMRLRNLGAIDPEYTAQGLKGLEDGPRVDKTVWARFAEDPIGLAGEEARIRASWQPAEKIPVGHQPSRGPMPVFGEMTILRRDWPTSVYLMRLEGSASENVLRPGTSPLLKLGISNATDRRTRELNAGFPSVLGLEWRLIRSWPFENAAAAWAVERMALSRCYEAGWSRGGEFVQCQEQEAISAIESGLADSK